MIKFDSFMNWSTPPEGVILKYAKKCYDFYNDESLFKSFKTDPDYTLILEGSQKSVADIFFGELLSNSRFKEFFIDNLDKIKENDTLGSPILHDYGEYGHLSLGTLKYAWNCSVIKDYFNIDSVSRVVEIGGGYGGMCKTLESFIEFDEYVDIDIPEAVLLWDKYMSNFKDVYSKCKSYSPTEIEDKDLSCDLVIADSSLAECSIELQNYYLNSVLLKAKRGFVIYNTLHLEKQRQFYNYMMQQLTDNDYSINSRTLHGSSVMEILFTK